MSSAVERILIENSVAPIPALAIVRTQAQTLQQATGTRINTDGYLKLLIAAAINLDSTQRRPTRSRTAMQHEQMDDPFTDVGEIDHIEYNIDTPFDLVLANAHAGMFSYPVQPGFFKPEKYQLVSGTRQIHETKTHHENCAISL